MSSDALPGPWERLRRDRHALIAVLVLAALATSTSYVRESAGVELQGSVDSNWRGAYDLLVRPLGERLDLEVTGGLVEPNFLGFAGGGGISFEQLESIRALADVELAAPVATIGNMQYAVGGPVLGLATLPERPTLYEVTIRVTSADGLGEVLVQEQVDRVLLGPADPLEPDSPSASATGSISAGSDGVFIFYEALPAISTPVVAVDPAAERELLGPTAGFLDAFGPIERLPLKPTVADFDVSLIADEFEDQRFFISALASGPNAASARERPVIPVVVSTDLYASLTVTGDVSQVGEPLSEYPAALDTPTRLEEAARLAGDGRTAIGQTEIDASRALRPLQAPRLMLVWPGTPAPEGSAASVGLAPELSTELAGRPGYLPMEPRDSTDRLTFRVAPTGVVDAGGTIRDPDDIAPGPVTLGLEAAYRDSETVSMPLVEDFESTGGLDRPFVFAPIASFDLRALDLPDDPLTYVPLGAYAPPDSRYLAPPVGPPPSRPVSLMPTLNPKGFINLPPLAITDMASAELLRGPDPIDAVRVRVAGLDRFDEAGVRRVERVASMISALGLEVDIVAGSSPQPVELYVAGYRVESDPPADLGWVEQGWTTMGAAARVVAGLGGTNTALLVLSVATALAFGACLQLLQIGMRTREVAILRSIGWRRRRIARWIVGEALTGGAIVVVVGVGAWLVLGGGALTGVLMAGLLGAAIPVASVLGLPILLRAPAVPTLSVGDVHALASRTPTVRSAWTYGLRAALARPTRLAAVSLSLGIAAGSVSVGAVVVASTAAAVGPTRLAGALSGVLAPYQVAILTIVAIGAALLAILLLRLDQIERRPEFVVLRSCGWTTGTVRRLIAAHRFTVGVLSTAVGATVALGLGGSLGVASPIVLGGVAGLVVVAALSLEVGWVTR